MILLDREDDFRFGGGVSWASSIVLGDPTVTLTLNGGVEVRAQMTPKEARDAGIALLAAAQDAESRLPTGLGESEAA